MTGFYNFKNDCGWIKAYIKRTKKNAQSCVQYSFANQISWKCHFWSKSSISDEGRQPMWIMIFYVLGLFKGSFGLFNAYWVVFGLYLYKTEEKN